LERFAIRSGYPSILTTSLTVSNSLAISPKPSNLLIKLYGSNYSNSSKCSPKPIKIMGLSVAATADKAPPPLA
jgi:hypothetical protein